MAETTRIIYPCDHTVQENSNSYGEIQLKRSMDASSPDRIPNNIIMIRIDMIYTIDNVGNKTYYYNNYNYNQSLSLDALDWIYHEPSNNPAPGDTYYILGNYVKTDIVKYDASTCHRCGGNGWYVSLINANGTNINKIDGMDKLAQDFIKILYTEKDFDSGYGSTIKDIIGLPIYDPNIIYSEIISSISDCTDIIKTNQKQAILNGAEIDDDETLSDVQIQDIQYSRDEATFYISIQIINILGDSIKFNFKT